jgi:hypothetical protein
MSWSWHEHGITREDTIAMTPSQRLEAVVHYYWRAVADGWQPPVARADWVGPHDPFQH